VLGAVRDAGPDYWDAVSSKTRGRGAARQTGLPAELGGRPHGSARFRTEPAAAGTAAQIQQTIELAKLQEIAEALMREEDVRTGEAAQVQDLMLIGTSMGARAKAVVEDGEGLWITKFNRPDDRWNNTRVERAMLELAKTWGVSVATSCVETIGGKDVLLVKRFDREKTDKGYQRARMMSGLTLPRAEERRCGTGDLTFCSRKNCAAAIRSLRRPKAQSGKRL
jgi:serine/threonine-protein kinase HipA